MNKASHALPGCPSRHEMVRAAIYMEHRGFDWKEWNTISRLCGSSKAIRQYILAYVKDALDMWDGLVPTRGSNSHEIAYIAAFHSFCTTRKEIHSEQRADALARMKPESWSKARYEVAWEDYIKRTEQNVKVTTALKESLEHETCEFYNEPYASTSSCSIVPFPAARR